MRTPSKRGSLDARVHYAVLKIRTEPCVKTPHPGGLVRRPFESAPFESGCFLRTQQCARSPSLRRPSFRSSPEGKSVLAGPPGKGNRIASAPLESMGAQVNVCHLRAPVLLRKEVIQPHLPVRLPCSRLPPYRYGAWTISSSWFGSADASLDAINAPVA